MRARTLAVGIVFFFFGLVFTATIIGAIIGVPLLLIGLLLIIVGAVSSEPRPQIVYAAPQPIYYPVPPPPPPFSHVGATPVTVNVQAGTPLPPPPQIMRRCRYCNSVYPESSAVCPKCGAPF